MATVFGAALVKDKSGMLTIHEEYSPPKLVWKSIDSSINVPIIEIPLDRITNLQATKPSSAKMMLNVITKENETAAPKKNVFAFTHRPTMDNIKGALQQIVARKKTSIQAAQQSISEGGSNTATPSGAPGTPQAQLQQQQAQQQQQQQIVVDDEFLSNLLDSKRLLKNHALQQKVLIENKQLMSTFQEAVMNNGLDPTEFWNTRIHLLRSYAIQHNQRKGPYNVLSTIKPVASSDNQVDVSVTREKIHAIFEQYPIVRKAYDDNVPKLSEGDFWSRFFSSKLFRKLRGEKNYNKVRGDIILDKYLYYDPDFTDDIQGDEDEIGKNKKQKTNEHIDKFIDVFANEEDVSAKYGNAPDMTMRYDKDQDMVSILRDMNRLSKNMLSNATKDKDETLEEEEHEKEDQLAFSDLEEKETTEYNELKVNSNLNIAANLLEKNGAKIDKLQYSKFISNMKSYFDEELDLAETYESEESKKQILEASKEISAAVKLNSKQSRQSWQISKLQGLDSMQMLSSSASSASSSTNITAANNSGNNGAFPTPNSPPIPNASSGSQQDEIIPDFPVPLLENLRLTHSTSIEFLRHFWLHFSSGSKHQVGTLQKLYNSLQKSHQRVDAILKQIEDNPKLCMKAKEVMGPLINSLDKAIQKYEAELYKQANNDNTPNNGLTHKSENNNSSSLNTSFVKTTT
ncbi:hypothetical protein PACTADRAFT_50501 [Pachysolen tannophilus NRRL Y-2460]|uniref:BSD domain-containing protein n=1 Tax=Pachysolen tannophilus NRRL Y-2460 TaxID=669874 RepID=A0A1E4TS99_PACTA|nr:hypothetical protein PACTADRAFT_50501 [Pachysolen tannophilus NRRL Y-2460]